MQTRSHRPAALAALAGLVWSVSSPTLFAQPQVQAPAPGQAVPAQPAAVAHVFLDEAVTAPDALSRVRELADAGNFTEAVRVLQDTLEAESEQVVKSPTDPALYHTTRDVVNAMLLPWKELLDKYRAEQEPAAKADLDAGGIAHVLRTRFLTPSGFEAALRTAQTDMECARFEAARLTLEEAATHPDCTGQHAADAARLAARLRSYLPRADMDAFVTRLAKLAGPQAKLDPASLALAPIKPPASELLHARTPFDPFLTPPWDQLSTQPLQSVALSPQPQDDRPQWAAANDRPAAWVFPTVAGDSLYICDDQVVAAYDAATLAQIWRTNPSRVSPPAQPLRSDQVFFNGPRNIEDASAPAVSRGVVVAITGLPINGLRETDPRVHALRASDGTLLWSVNPRWADDALETGVLRGPPVIDGDTVVVGVRKPGTTRRIITLYLVGIDLSSGQVRWRRLVGSVGSQLWGRTQSRADATTLDRGVVYRGDDMGVLGAFDATTGRPLWVRQAGSGKTMDPNMGFQQPDDLPAFEIQKPVVRGDSVFFVEPSNGGVIEVNRLTGALLARRPARDLGNPGYLVLVDDMLACVSHSGVSFIPANALASGAVSIAATEKIDKAVEFVGRAVAMGGSLCVPASGAIGVIDAHQPSRVTVHTLPRTGNMVVPTGDDARAASIAHAIVVDTQGVHTFLSWEKAQSTLEARVAKDPSNPVPVLTYLQLALRQGKGDLAPRLADQALALIRKAPVAPAAQKARTDLFDLLHATISSSRQVLTPTEGTPTQQTAFSIPPLRDAAILSTLADRILLTADSPRERTLALLDRAYLREFTQAHEGAVEDLQEVLADPALARLSSEELDLPGARDAGSAGDIATEALSSILLATGPTPYRAFDDEATAVLATIDPAAPAATLADTARRYPLAAAAPALWSRAADAARREKQTALTRECLARGIESAILARRIGRETPSTDEPRLAGDLLAFAATPADQEPTLLLLSRLASSAPDSTVATPTGNTPLRDALTTLRASLAQRAGLPSIGPVIADRVQAIEGWQPVDSLNASRPGESTCLVPMLSRNAERVAVFAPSLSDSRLAALWQRECDIAPTFLRVTPDYTLLYFARTTDPTLEAISNHDGSTIWKSPPLATLLTPPDGAPPPTSDRIARINTPLDGLVRPDDLLFAGNTETLIISRRDAHAVAINLRDGKPRWHASLPMDRVFDLDCSQSVAAAIGAKPNDTIKEALEPVAIGLDLSTGRTTWTAPSAAIGDHARWVRMLPDSGALVGTSDKVMRISPAGAVAWSNATRPMRNTGSAWLCGDAAFILDDSYDLRRLTLATGDAREQPLDDNGRLHLPFEVRAARNHVAVTSEQGLVVFNGEGDVVGVDAIETPGALAAPILCDNALVTIQVFPREDGYMRSSTVDARVLIFSFPDGRMLSQRRISLFDEPESIHAADGKLLIDQGTFTSVVDLRP